MNADEIHRLLAAYRTEISPTARYASFDYCYNHFQEARERSEGLDRMRDGDGLLVSSLHLGFYLASWGMMRGSTDLLQNSVRALAPVVQMVAGELLAWDIDLGQDHYGDAVLEFYGRVKHAFHPVKPSGTLVTKTMLGVFGCVPAFDQFFCRGFRHWTVTTKNLDRIASFYRDNAPVIDAISIPTLNALTGEETERRYPKAKIIDMVFFQKGGGSQAKL